MVIRFTCQLPKLNCIWHHNKTSLYNWLQRVEAFPRIKRSRVKADSYVFREGFQEFFLSLERLVTDERCKVQELCLQNICFLDVALENRVVGTRVYVQGACAFLVHETHDLTAFALFCMNNSGDVNSFSAEIF